MQRLIKRGADVRAAHEQSPATRSARERPRLSLGIGSRAELGRDLPRLVVAGQSQICLDQLGGGREIDVGYPKLAKQFHLMLELARRGPRVSETQFELAERRGGPNLVEARL